MRAFKSIIACLFVIVIYNNAISQNLVTISGSITAADTKRPLQSVSVTIKGTKIGTITDAKGLFKIATTQQPPFTVVISSLGFSTKEVQVNAGQLSISAELESSTELLGQTVVVAASRIPERILESPVSIERLNSSAIKASPSVDYYGAFSNIKGVDVTTSSLTFKTISTRGFNASGNERLNQIVDGMDNQAPGLNFSVGSIIGLTELDVDNMELLSGASSALYGSGGMNGTVLINSKSPFTYQGFSAQVKEGIMHVDSKYRNASPYHDISMRWGVKVSDKFAFKLGAQFIHAKDWLAGDSANFLRDGSNSSGKVITGNRLTDPNFDGVNIYGDETTTQLNPFIQGAVLAGLPQNQQDQALAILAPFTSSPFNVSRTGYNEKDVVPPNAIDLKLSGGLYYKIKNDLELSLIGYYGNGNAVYTGSDRFALRNLKMGQYKLELKQKNWFMRLYTTQENSGESYDATITTRVFNEYWKRSYDPSNPAASWFPQYAGAFVQGALTTWQTAFQTALGGGQNQQQAAATAEASMLSHSADFNNAARAFADQGRPLAGTTAFNQLFDQVRSTPISKGGGLFLDRTNLYVAEGQYNLTDVLKIGSETNRTEILAGASFKKYVLNSQGTLFADTAGHISINESGAYLQAGQKLFDGVLKLTASGRYDKQNNFQGKFTPRFSAVIKVAKDQNIRLSYQTAYRFPTSQNQWINLTVGGGARLLGGLPQLRDYYGFNTNPAYSFESFSTFASTHNPADLKQQKFASFKPESSNTIELGYKGLIANKVLIDVYGYYSQYKDFLGRSVVLQSSDPTNPLVGLANPNIYSVSVNSTSKVKTLGWGASIDYLLEKNFFIKSNVYFDDIKDVAADFVSGFNTPKYRFNLGFGNSGFGPKKQIGFNVIYKWQQSFFYTSDFVSGQVPAYGVLDAQLSYKLAPQKLIFKLGANNMFNKYYRNGFGNPYIGGLYYVSIGYNIF